jgi:hypothetical protein
MYAREALHENLSDILSKIDQFVCEAEDMAKELVSSRKHAIVLNGPNSQPEENRRHN